MRAAIAPDAVDPISASIYGTTGYPHEAWTRLRREDPVYWCQPQGYQPFWAVTKHADITAVSKRPDVFRSAGRFILFPESTQPAGARGDLVEDPPLRMLVNMDPPEHRDYRKLVSPWFTPRMVKRLEARLDQITAELFDELAGERELDFVTEIAAMQPLRMITEMLGIPREDEQFVLRVTNENFGLEDPEFQREGETAEERLGFLTEAAGFLNAIFEDRRAHPREDLSSVLANASLNGGPVPPFELFSLAFLVMVAGHDTTRNAIASGLLAFFWTTPVNHFSRTATRDVELRGKSIRAGDSVALFYASANRDEEVFDDPFAFRIDRQPNPHLGFGVGEHFCLGASLARMDLRVFWRHFVERVESIEPAAPHELLASSFVGGPKHVPVKLRIRARR
jgi:cytochrome P450